MMDSQIKKYKEVLVPKLGPLLDFNLRNVK